MPGLTTIVIGPPELAEALRTYPQTRETDLVTFVEQDAKAALDAILERRPRFVAVPHTIAQSTRGKALVHRIISDPELTGIQLLVISATGLVSPLVAPAAPPWAPVDYAGLRRVPRIRVRDGVDVQLDGAAARLVDLSTLGAQVVSPTILRPNQRLRVALPSSSGALRVVAVVLWASFELPKGRPEPQYRAGLEFKNHDPSVLEPLCSSYAAADQPAARNA